MTRTRLINAIVIEDNAGDRKLLENVFMTSRLRWSFYFLGDSIEALKLLSKFGKYADTPDPDLIILDINMPKMDGWELLRKIKVSHRHRETPVIILTSSSRLEDQARAKDLGVEFFTKPTTLTELSTLAERIEWLWLNRYAEKVSG